MRHRLGDVSPEKPRTLVQPRVNEQSRHALVQPVQIVPQLHFFDGNLMNVAKQLAQPLDFARVVTFYSLELKEETRVQAAKNVLIFSHRNIVVCEQREYYFIRGTYCTLEGC